MGHAGCFDSIADVSMGQNLIPPKTRIFGSIYQGSFWVPIFDPQPCLQVKTV